MITININNKQYVSLIEIAKENPSIEIQQLRKIAKTSKLPMIKVGRNEYYLHSTLQKKIELLNSLIVLKKSLYEEFSQYEIDALEDLYNTPKLRSVLTSDGRQLTREDLVDGFMKEIDKNKNKSDEKTD